MARIDSDAHVDETEDTWRYLEESEARFAPTTIDSPSGRDRLWSFGGVEFRRPVRNYQRTGATETTSQLLDVAARLRHLDELRIDLQVLYPTIFIRSRFAGQEDLELAMTRSYNRWIAQRTEESNGRLRWVAVLPLMSMDLAVKELEWAKEHGACGVFKKGLECESRVASDPYFFPLYEAASELNLPMCIHTGSDGHNEINSPTAWDAVKAFNPLVTSDVLEKFPDLRVGFIEAGASWVPFLLTILAASGRHAHMQGINLDNSLDLDLDLFRRLRIYVACQSQDDLPYLLRYGLEDNLLVGTDYTHADQSAELKALDYVEQRGLAGQIPMAVTEKILDTNPRRFFGL
jgi:predicted TIM-barrel fold metal-dependent hydrolase